jgi:UDP-glucose 4-epimerase
VKRVLITGGFGFIGGRLTDLLLQCPDYQVHVIDNLSAKPLFFEDRLPELKGCGRLTYSIQDLAKPLNGLAHAGFDEIYHLASIVGPAGVLPYSGEIAASILSDALAMARLAEACQCRLVYVSTSEVYGGGLEGFCSEEMPGLIPARVSARGEYAAGKLAAEVALLNLARSRGVDVCVARPFNVAGPRQSGGGGFVLPRFIGMALASQPLTVFGTGLQRRAFTDVRDIACGLIAVAQRGKFGGVYNLGNPQNLCAILDLAREVKCAVGSSSEIRFVDGREIYGPLYEEAGEKFPDTTRVREELGWEPHTSRHQTIHDTVAYMRNLPEDLLRRARGF